MVPGSFPTAPAAAAPIQQQPRSRRASGWEDEMGTGVRAEGVKWGSSYQEDFILSQTHTHAPVALHRHVWSASISKT